MKTLSEILMGVVLFLSLSSLSYKKNKIMAASPQAIDGVITGFDQRACPCCGGLMITFTGEAKPYVQSFFLVENDPASLGFDANSNFPVAVKVKYTRLEKCNHSFVKILKLVWQ